MPLYVDLQPAPQFDRSLVAYCVVNFGRIRDVLNYAGKRVDYLTRSDVGPYDSYITFTVPFRCDLVLWTEITFYVASVGLGSMQFYLDTTKQASPNNFAEQFFNETYSRKKVSTMLTYRNVSAGIHWIHAAYQGQVAYANDGDFWHMQFTFYEL